MQPLSTHLTQLLTLADVMAVSGIRLILRGHHDVPGCHPSLRLQTETLHAAAETNTQTNKDSVSVQSRFVNSLWLYQVLC